MSSGMHICRGDPAPPQPEFGFEFGDTKFRAPNFGPNSGVSCKRGRQKGVSLICSENKSKKSEQIRTNRNKSGYSRKRGAQIGTNRKKTGKSVQIGVTPNWGLRGLIFVLPCFPSEKIRSHLGTLALKTGDFSKKSVVLVKRKNGFTKTVPWTENPRKTRRRAF